MDSVDFDFGFNAPIEHDDDRTAVVTDSDSLMWRDIEAVRRAARADVETIASGPWSRALAFVSRIRIPALRTWAARWVAYCTTPGTDRPVFHAGKAGEACRRVELQLADFGIVDPEGFSYGRAERGPKRKRKFRGAFRGVAGQLQEFNERMRGPWIG